MKIAKPIYVVSDLHIGSGGRRDNLSTRNREKLFLNFLDFVESQNGRLVILGDFLDLWRFNFRKTLDYRRDIFDRLAEMDVKYVLGNHDEALAGLIGSKAVPHPFFNNICRCFELTIGLNKFKFMHGHEIDPIGRRLRPRYGRAIGRGAAVLEFLAGSPIFYADMIEKIILEIEETVLDVYSWLIEKLQRFFVFEFARPAGLPLNITQTIRNKRTIRRHLRHIRTGSHDITICGHTHRAGRFRDWYINSGSWTGAANNFLQIVPDGEVSMFNWTEHGPKRNEIALIC